jgi:transcriptional regulator GlxA family with amidase domain
MKKIPRTKEIEQLMQVQDIIVCECHKRFTAEELAQRVSMDVEELKIRFKDWTTRTLERYQTYTAVTMGRIFLEGSDRSIRAVAAEVGYTNPNSFYRQFKRFYGLSPRAYRKQQKENPPPITITARSKRRRSQHAR